MNSLKVFRVIDEHITNFIENHYEEIFENIDEPTTKEIVLTDDEQECCVCYEQKQLQVTECKHSFCVTCGERLLICPMCRSKLDKPKENGHMFKWEQYIIEMDYNGIYFGHYHQPVELLESNHIRITDYLEMCEYLYDEYERESVETTNMLESVNQFIRCVFYGDLEKYYNMYLSIVERQDNGESGHNTDSEY
jgi:hypothetical protein